MEVKEALQKLWPNEIQDLFRKELETAWLRGFRVARNYPEAEDTEGELELMAADYAERVVGGSTRSGEPNAPRSLGEQSSPQRPERPEVKR